MMYGFTRMWQHARKLPVLAAALTLLGAAVSYAQSPPPVLPDHTVYGRLGTGTGSGPGQAIPFATLGTFIGGGSSGLTVGTTPVINGTNGQYLFNNSGILGNAALGTMATQNANSVAITGGTITGLGLPSVSTDAANKQYVDNSIVGLIIHSQALLATAAALPANTYNNGTSGVGATLTGNSNGALTVDGTLTVTTNRIIVKNEAAPANNGIYVVTTVGDGSNPYVLTRATDANTAGTSDPTKIGLGTYVFVISGASNGNTGWSVTSTVTTIGTSAINWSQFSVSGGAAGNPGGTANQIQYNASGTFGGIGPGTNNQILAGSTGSHASFVNPTSLWDSFCSSSVGQFWVRMSSAWGCTSLGYLDPVWFGADPTGVADSAAAINSAIAALPAKGGQVNFVHCGTYNITSGIISIGNGSSGVSSTTNGVRLTSPSPSCITLKSTSPSFVVQVNGPYTGFEISGFTIDCNSVANIGLLMTSVAVWESRRGMVFASCRQYGAVLNTVTGLNTMQGVADNWQIVMPAVSGAVGMLLDGNCSGGGGTSLVNDAYQNIFNNLQIFPNNTVPGHGIIVKSADTNVFNSLLIYSSAGTVNAGFNSIVFDYSGCNLVPSVNLFNIPDIGHNIPSSQQWASSSSVTGVANFITNISTLNGGIIPGANAAWVIK